jgi:hypothetical protein
MMKRLKLGKYLVKEVQDAPRFSHLNHLFPECIYTLIRQEDGRTFRIRFVKSAGWQSGDRLELDEGAVKAACLE